MRNKPPRCRAIVKKTGDQCKNVAHTDGYCILHSKAFATAVTVELPEPEFVGVLEYDADALNVHEQHDADGNVTGVLVADLGTEPPAPGELLGEGWTEVGATEQGWKFENLADAATEAPVDLQSDTNAASGFGPRYESKRCPEKGCGQLRGHDGHHDGPTSGAWYLLGARLLVAVGAP